MNLINYKINIIADTMAIVSTVMLLFVKQKLISKLEEELRGGKQNGSPGVRRSCCNCVNFNRFNRFSEEIGSTR